MALAVASQHHVVNNVHVADKTHAEPVLGYERESHTEVSYLHRGFAAQVVLHSCFRVVIKYLAVFNMLKTRYGFKQLSLTASGDSGNSENLA